MDGLADADDAQVRERIASDDPELLLRAVDEGGLPAIGTGHHVGGGDEVAVGREGDRRCPLPPADQPPIERLTRRLATDGISRSATELTTRE